MAIRVGISSAIWDGDPCKTICNGRPIDYLESTLAEYFTSRGAIAYLVPSVKASRSKLQAYVEDLDAIVLQGGNDVCPRTYGENPLRPEWEGDGKRDVYDLILIEEARRLNKPILGICRGLQILNVAFGGTLYQDILYCLPEAQIHRDEILYEKNEHQIEIVAGGELEKIYPNIRSAQINSVHHQAIKDLSPNFILEARSSSDGLIEAISKKRESPDEAACLGVQWHPEYQSSKNKNKAKLNSRPLLDYFMNSAELCKKA